MKNRVLISLRGNRTQKEIAEQLKVSVSTYSALENNTRFPGKALLKRISEYFGKSIEEIFFS